MLEIEFLGTGTSCGVPTVRCHCPVCKSTDLRDQRLRCSSIVRYGGKNILIDCGPDFRQQMLRATSDDLDALLLTHIHYDHAGGIDDLRPYTYEHDFPIYARKDVIIHLRQTMPYVFGSHQYPGVPQLNFIEVKDNEAFKIGDVEVNPISVIHGRLPILGYRIGPLAYITDCKTLADEQIEQLENVPLLVLSALRWTGLHHSHLLVDEALELVSKIKPRRTLLIHMTHEIGFHDEVNHRLPDHVQLAFDTQIVRIEE